jgi:hypothetical protein
VSRRRKAVPHPKRRKDLDSVRVRFFCTSFGAHEPFLLREYSRRVQAGRPDLDYITMYNIDAAALEGRLPTCGTCGRPGPPLADDSPELARIFDELAKPGRVVRIDVTTWRLL